MVRLRWRVRRRRKKTTEVVYLISRLPVEEQDAAGLLKLKRGYWGIESRLQHALDVTPGEYCSRGRQPAAAFVLSLFRRRVVSCALIWIATCRARKPKSHATTRQFQKRFAHHDGGPAFRQ